MSTKITFYTNKTTKPIILRKNKHLKKYMKVFFIYYRLDECNYALT